MTTELWAIFDEKGELLLMTISTSQEQSWNKWVPQDKKIGYWIADYKSRGFTCRKVEVKVKEE